MSELLSSKPEHQKSPERAEQPSEHIESHHKHEKPREQVEKASDSKLGEIRRNVERLSHKASDELPKTEHTEPAFTPTGIGKDLKNQALFRTLKNVRQHLSLPDRTLSKVVHQPVVDAASELGSKTIARSSGVLGGGVCAFLGSLLYLYLAKHNGFHYNYLLFLLFFIGGFAAGLSIE